MKQILEGYHKFAVETVLTTTLTVMLWLAAQNLILEAVNAWFPAVKLWAISVVEIVVAVCGLYLLTRRGNNGKDKEGIETKEEIQC